MHSRHYIVGAVVVALATWGPLDHDSWWSMVVRLGYLIVGPLVTWFVLKSLWKQWRPDEDAEDRLQRMLEGMASGMLLAWVITRLEQGFWGERAAHAIYIMVPLSAFCFYLSVTKIRDKRD